MLQEVGQETLARVIPIKIGDVLCNPKFKCIHLTNPGQDQLKKDLHRYRFKEVFIQLFENAQDYSASDEWLHFKVFAEKAESLCLIGEYTNMMRRISSDYSEKWFKWTTILKNSPVRKIS